MQVLFFVFFDPRISPRSKPRKLSLVIVYAPFRFFSLSLLNIFSWKKPVQCRWKNERLKHLVSCRVGLKKNKKGGLGNFQVKGKGREVLKQHSDDENGYGLTR